MAYPVISTSVGIGALSGATRLLFPAPSAANGGGVTVRAAYVNQSGSTNSSLILTKGTLAGGTFTANGTISSAAVGGTSDAFAAGIVKTFGIGSTNFVSANEWIAIAEGSVAACSTVALVTIEYEAGR